MLGWINQLFGRKEPAPVSRTSYWTPETVEAAINEAGRAEVFAEARRLGWTPESGAPLWVWAQIASVVRQMRMKRETQEAAMKGMLEYEQHVASLKDRTLN